MFLRSVMSVVKSKRLCGCPFSWYPRWGCCYVPARIWNGLGRHSDSRRIENCSISAQIRRSGKDYKVMILDHLSWDGFQFYASSNTKWPFYKITKSMKVVYKSSQKSRNLSSVWNPYQPSYKMTSQSLDGAMMIKSFYRKIPTVFQLLYTTYGKWVTHVTVVTLLGLLSL